LKQLIIKWITYISENGAIILYDDMYNNFIALQMNPRKVDLCLELQVLFPQNKKIQFQNARN